MVSLSDTIQTLRDVLRLGDRANGFTESTRLLGGLPEFDSMAVVSVLTSLEDRFGIPIDDDEITADIFETVGTLHTFILAKLDD